MENIEHKNDEVTHNIFIELGRNFITPFDREDIHSLIKAMDNVADNMHGAASRMRLYQVEKITKSISKNDYLALSEFIKTYDVYKKI